jgi:TIR domain-containing protein
VSTLFFSYSHADQDLRDQLEKHLSGLQRRGVISSWHDRRITPGTELGEAIDSHLDAADAVLLLVSPDFIASDYCYEREMTRALERHEKSETRVIPVILRPCDWHDLPFGKLLATPTDGRPITMWPNIDAAFLDVITSIKHALKELGRKPRPNTQTRETPSDEPGSAFREPVRSSNLRIMKKFSDLDRDRFRHDGFEYIAKFFENSLKELVSRNAGVDQTFRRIDANRWSAVAYRGGEKVCRGSASIAGGAMGHDSIEYSMTDEPRGSMNEAVFVKADDQILYFEVLGMQSHGHEREKLTFQGAAELFWELFIRPLQS